MDQDERVRERDRRERERRLVMLGLPVVALRRHGLVGAPADDVRSSLGQADPVAVGVGPGGELLAYWPAPGQPARQGVVTRTITGTRQDTSTLVVHDPPDRVHFVQPMPDGGVLLSAARTFATDGVTAGVWGQDGRQRGSGCLGDAIEHLLTTPSGQIWVGYFDEASGLRGYPTGVARFDAALNETWRYDWSSGMPDHLDCCALNVDGETATTYAYTAWHLTRIDESSWTDLGPAPRPGASGLLLDGDRAVLVGGYGAEYDLLTPLRVTPDGIRPAGPLQRLVRPDGLEVVGGRRVICRGRELHVIHRGDWLRLAVADVLFTSGA